MAQSRSLNSQMLAYAAGFTLLLLALSALGGLGLVAWQKSSRESLRLHSMIGEIQEMRGNLYRQVKEVFDAVFLHDHEASSQYLAYAQRIDRHFDTLSALAANADEREAVGKLRKAYDEVRKRSEHLARQPEQFTTAMRQRFFDTELEEAGFGTYEAAFQGLDLLLYAQQQELHESLERTVKSAPLLLMAPVILGGVLLVFSRGFVHRAVVQPLSAILDATTRISQGRLDHRVPETGATELVTLARAVNRMAEDLERNREDLVRSEKQATLGALVPVVAHNIRNPLASIRATVQVMDDPALAPELREGLADILSSADRLERWTDSLLSYLHPLRPQFGSRSLAAIADAVLEILRARLEARDIRVLREGWDDAPEIPLDVELMEQSVTGLVNNAIDASPRGGVLTLAADRSGDQARLLISDQGSGMAFNPRGAGLTPGPSTKRLGTGLGIPFAMKVCDVHGGRVSFGPSPAGGTQVILSLPLRQAQIHDPN